LDEASYLGIIPSGVVVVQADVGLFALTGVAVRGGQTGAVALAAIGIVALGAAGLRAGGVHGGGQVVTVQIVDVAAAGEGAPR